MAEMPAAAASTPEAQSARRYMRFDLPQRAEHVLFVLAFTTLALTGLAQKFAGVSISEWFIGLLGGIEITRRIHRMAAIVMMLEAIYHIVSVLYRMLVQRASASMLPGPQDFRHVIQDILYYVGRRKRGAYYARYSYAEKVEYFAVVWGTLIMAITGFMMWNPVTSARWFSGQIIPAAKAAHGGEAILAVLAILLWHFYHVHLRHLNKSMFTGWLSREEMLSEHPAELSWIDSGQHPVPPSPEVLRKRRRVFFPMASVLSAALLFGVFRFITFEQTAITTLPGGETAPIFVPQTPTPMPTLPPTLAAAPASLSVWTGQVEVVLAERCGACHGSAAVAGLDLSSYAAALKGGKDGPVIVPGDPEASRLVQIQSSGGHPGQLTDEELDGIIAWIRSGAPER